MSADDRDRLAQKAISWPSESLRYSVKRLNAHSVRICENNLRSIGFTHIAFSLELFFWRIVIPTIAGIV